MNPTPLDDVDLEDPLDVDEALAAVHQRTPAPRRKPARPRETAPPAKSGKGKREPQDAKPEQERLLLERVAVFFARRWDLHGPLTVPGLLYLAGRKAFEAGAGADAAIVLGAAGIGIGGHLAYRYLRRKPRRPLLAGERLWHFAVTGAACTYLTAASVLSPAKPGMLILLGALGAPLGASWLLRARILDWLLRDPTPAPDATGAPAETSGDAPETAGDGQVPGEPAAEEAFPQAPRLRALWSDRLTGTGARLNRTALADITPNPPAYGGFTARVLLNTGKGPIQHTPDFVVSQHKLVTQAMREFYPSGVHASNVLVEENTDGTAQLYVFERHPLSAVHEYTPPTAPVEYTIVDLDRREHVHRDTLRHEIGRLVSGQVLEIQTWEPGRGPSMTVVTGTTGSGKSSVMRSLVIADGNTRDQYDRPIVAPWILDPHGGVSFGDLVLEVPVFAHTAAQIKAALLAAYAEHRRRLGLMRRARIDLLPPTFDRPMINLVFDEMPEAVLRDPSIVPLIVVLGTGGRKTCIKLTVGSITFTKKEIPDSKLLDVFAAGWRFNLRGGSFYTSLALGGPDARQLFTHFSDGTPTGGLGYHIGGGAITEHMARFNRPGQAIAAAARFAPGPVVTLPPDEDEDADLVLTDPAATEAPDAGTGAEATERDYARAVDYLEAIGEPAELREIAAALRLDDEDELFELLAEAVARGELVRLDDGRVSVPAYAPRRPAPDLSATAAETAIEDAPPDPADVPGDLDQAEDAAGAGALEQIAAELEASGHAMTLDELHKATGVAKNTLSMALARGAKRKPPAVVKLEGCGRWDLPGRTET